jgi:DNA repair exonuclease SbcCD ATPase subunit
MSNQEIPDQQIPSEIAPINPGEIIRPAQESLHNAFVTQNEVKKDYRSRVEAQEEVRARYLAKVKREKEELKKHPDIIKLKIRNLKDQHDECLESLHYAKQDYDALLQQADLTGKTSAAKEVMERIEKEIWDARREISELEALL